MNEEETKELDQAFKEVEDRLRHMDTGFSEAELTVNLNALRTVMDGAGCIYHGLKQMDPRVMQTVAKVLLEMPEIREWLGDMGCLESFKTAIDNMASGAQDAEPKRD